MRLFVAVWPPPHVVSQLSALERLETQGVRWVDQWHVTLRFLGGVEESAALKAFRRIEPPRGVRARVGPRSARLGRRVLQLPVAGLGDLAAAVERVTSEVGQPVRPFRGHLTLARARGRSADLSAIGPIALEATWPVEEITLVDSALSSSGPAYRVIERLTVPR